MALTLNEQFAFRTQYEELNFLKYEIKELTTNLSIDKAELQEIEGLRSRVSCKSLLFRRFPYRLEGVSHVFYGNTGDTLELGGQIWNTVDEPFPYNNLELFEQNPRLYIIAIVIYKAAANNFASLSFADVLNLLQETASANDIIAHIAHPEEIFKVFLTTALKLPFLEREDLFFFKETMSEAYNYIISKEESEAFPCLINTSFSKFSPGWPFCNFNEFDVYCICNGMEEKDATAAQQMLEKALRLLKIASNVAYKVDTGKIHIYVEYEPEFCSFRLFRGPLVTEEVDAAEFKRLFGELAEFRRFSTGEMRICIFFEQNLSRDELAEYIVRYLLSAHCECDSVRIISTNTLISYLPKQFSAKRLDDEITAQIERLRAFLMVANRVHTFEFIVTDVSVGGYELVGDPAVLNGFVRISAAGAWYYSIVGNQLLKALILDKLRSTLHATGDFSLEFTSTHIIARFEINERLLEVRLFVITDVDDLITRNHNPTKADFMGSLLNSKAAQVRLVTTLMSVHPGYAEGVRLAQAFVESHQIPTYNFQPALVDFVGVFAAPPFIQIYNRFLELAKERGLEFSEVFTTQNMLDDEVKEALEEAERVGEHQLKNLEMSHIGSKDAISAELISLICALPYCENDISIEIPVPHSGIAVFRQFLKFFCFSERRTFELNCALDEIVPVERFIKIAIPGDPEGALFGNISGELFQRIRKHACTALQWIDRCISGEQLWEGAIFNDEEHFDYVLVFSEVEDLPGMESLPLACLDPITGDGTVPDDILRQIIPGITSFCKGRFTVFEFPGRHELGLQRCYEHEPMRPQDLPDNLTCMRLTEDGIVFDEERFLEEVVTFIGPLIEKVYCSQGNASRFAIPDRVEETETRSTFYNFYEQVEEEAFENEEE